jgi:hypothetical protein
MKSEIILKFEISNTRKPTTVGFEMIQNGFFLWQ